MTTTSPASGPDFPSVDLRDVRRALAENNGEPVAAEDVAAALGLSELDLVRAVLRAFGAATGVHVIRNGRGRVVALRGEGRDL
jgi:transcriptional regulator GlxA family with amidase domain